MPKHRRLNLTWLDSDSPQSHPSAQACVPREAAGFLSLTNVQSSPMPPSSAQVRSSRGPVLAKTKRDGGSSTLEQGWQPRGGWGWGGVKGGESLQMRRWLSLCLLLGLALSFCLAPSVFPVYMGKQGRTWSGVRLCGSQSRLCVRTGCVALVRLLNHSVLRLPHPLKQGSNKVPTSQSGCNDYMEVLSLVSIQYVVTSFVCHLSMTSCHLHRFLIYALLKCSPQTLPANWYFMISTDHRSGSSTQRWDSDSGDLRGLGSSLFPSSVEPLADFPEAKLQNSFYGLENFYSEGIIFTFFQRGFALL